MDLWITHTENAFLFTKLGVKGNTFPCVNSIERNSMGGKEEKIKLGIKYK